MIWIQWSVDLSKGFQYLISCVQRVSTGQPDCFLSLPLTYFRMTLPFALGCRRFYLGNGVHMFIFRPLFTDEYIS